jgi:hypothetical protein
LHAAGVAPIVDAEDSPEAKMTGGRLLAGAVAGTFLAVSVSAASAFADDQPHFFNNNLATAWSGGCQVTYSLTPEAAGYAPYAEAAFGHITEQTNISFSRLPNGDATARVRIGIYTAADGWSGWGSTDGIVTLKPLESIPVYEDEVRNNNMRTTLVAHEALHTFGLDHDGTLTEFEVMAPILGDGSWTEHGVVAPVPEGPPGFSWGPSDVAGLTVLRTQNHCISPGVQDPAFAKPTAGPGTGTQVTVVLTTTTKMKCKKRHGRWYADTHRCVYSTRR